MNPRDLDATLIDSLRRDSGAEELEVFLKRGRSRRLVREKERQTQTEADERGWAVRATTARGSFFACGTGEPGQGAAWPEPDGYPLELPEPADVGEWKGPPQSEAPLASESELRALARAVDRELEQAAPRARLELLMLEDGQSESRIGNSHGVLSGWRTRFASLTLQASARGASGETVRAEWLRAELREMSPRRMAARLADQLAITTEGRSIARDRSEIVAAPEVAARLVAGLLPLFDSTVSEELVARLGGAERLGSSCFSLIDNGRLPGGVLASPVDGEGTPTREVVLVDEGVFKQPLLPWWVQRPGCRSGGCSRRDSWREQPRVGPSHLYLRPDPEVRATELVGSLSRGYYLLDVAGPGSFRFDSDRFELAVRGFEMLGGRARTPVNGVRLVGKITGLLRGLREVARDLTLVRLPVGLVGSPTIRLQGLELRG